MTLNAENAKPTVVLIHGWGLNHAIWQPVADVLATDYQVLVLDLPGYGLATHYPEPYSLEAITDQLAAQVPAQSFVLGWSLGGLVERSWHCAIRLKYVLWHWSPARRVFCSNRIGPA